MGVNMKKVFNSTLSILKKYIVIFSITIITLIIFLISRFSLIKLNISYNTLDNYISIVIGSISSLLGIIIAVYILAFGLFEKNFKGMAYRKFINSMALNYYIQLCISTILLMLISNFILQNNISNFSINLISLGIILYVLSLALIYPTIKSLISQSKSQKYIDELLNNLNEDTGEKYLQLYNNKHLDKNPFFQLASISQHLILSNEKILLNRIITKCFVLIKNKIDSSKGENGSSCREYIKAFVQLFKDIERNSLANEHLWAIHRLLGAYISIRNYAVKNKIPHYEFVEYEHFIDDMCKRCLKREDFSTPQRYLYFLFDFIEHNIKYNLPEESELFTFRREIISEKKYDHIKFAQWQYIEIELLSLIQRMNKLIIDLNINELFSQISLQFSSLFSFIINSETLSDKQKRSIILYSSYNFKDSLKKIIDKKVDFIHFSYDSFVISKSYEVNEDIFLILFKDYTEVIYYLAKSKMLADYLLNEYGTLGRTLSKYIDQGETIEISLKKMQNSLVTIGKSVENNLDIYSMDLYTNTYKQAESIVRWCRDSKAKNDALIYDLEEKLNQMDKIKQFHEIMNDEMSYSEILLSEMKIN